MVHVHFWCLHDFTAYNHFVKDLVDLVEIKDEVKFADRAEVLIEHFHEKMDELQVAKFIIILIDA